MPSSQVDSENMFQIAIRMRYRMGVQRVTQIVRIISRGEHWHGAIDDAQHRRRECKVLHDR